MNLIFRYLKKTIIKIVNFFGYEIRKNIKYFPIEASEEEKRIIELSSKFSMTGIERMYSAFKSLEYCIKNNLDGDIVECGVWKGGNLILFKKVLEKYKIKKKIWAYDTFSGMTKPQDIDADFSGELASIKLKRSQHNENKRNMWCYCSLDTVKKNLQKNSFTGLNNINFIKGDVLKTLRIKKNLPKKISLLRLDTDFYDSTKIELEILFPRLVIGGILIIDDYGCWQGARKAFDEYFVDNFYLLHYVDYSCRYLIKHK